MRHLVVAAALLVAAPALAGPTLSIDVTDQGFEPQRVTVKKGEPTTLVFTRRTDATCITAIDIPDENVKKLELPLGKPVSVTITPKRKGIERFRCSAMGMGDGKIDVVE
jgi:plastocyanin domain-containing protein